MTIQKKKYYLTPVLLSIIIFMSNFLSTELFHDGIEGFTVLFTLSLFAFTCGWLINKTIGWVSGGKVVYSVIVATCGLSILLVLSFSDYFGINNVITENVILYTLRNVFLGTMALFGMTVSELLILQREVNGLREKKDNDALATEETKRRSDLVLNEAKVKAEKILFEAERKAVDYNRKKEQIEARLKEFISAERELIRKYESDEIE